jgi:plasmid stabilization system protein ParE
VTLTVLPPAQDEIDADYAWHQQNRRGSGSAFLADVAEAFDMIERQPRAFSRVTRSFGGREVRRRVLANFPYSVVYEVTGDDVFVLAVAHFKRKPYYWARRRP